MRIIEKQQNYREESPLTLRSAMKILALVAMAPFILIYIIKEGSFEEFA